MLKKRKNDEAVTLAGEIIAAKEENLNGDVKVDHLKAANSIIEHCYNKTALMN